VARELGQDELIDRWTLVDDELALVAGKRGATRLGFALLLRFYTQQGRFPRGRSEIPDSAIEYVSWQVGVAATDVAFYDWSGRTIKAHRVEIRRALGFRECGVADADKLFRLDQPQPLQLVQPAGHLAGEIVSLRPVLMTTQERAWLASSDVIESLTQADLQTDSAGRVPLEHQFYTFGIVSLHPVTLGNTIRW
jgi:hypothetical protein